MKPNEEMLLYLCTDELLKISHLLNIDNNIYYESEKGEILKTSFKDDKITIVEKILGDKYITIYKKESVCHDCDMTITKNSKVLFKQFKSTNKQIKTILKEISFGQVVFYIVRLHWRENRPLTYKKLIELYHIYNKNPPERLKKSFMFNKHGILNWKKDRNKFRKIVFDYFKINYRAETGE
jgi:hypothetical protein